MMEEQAPTRKQYQQQGWQIEDVVPEDREWIEPIFRHNRKLLGDDFGTIWYRYWQATKQPGGTNEIWIAVRPYGFAQYRLCKNGMRSLYTIAVREDMKRKGIASTLLHHIGKPVLAKTNADNAESNDFYAALGFLRVGETFTRTGRKLHVYQIW